jgi:hypothetical protein
MGSVESHAAAGDRDGQEQGDREDDVDGGSREGNEELLFRVLRHAFERKLSA